MNTRVSRRFRPVNMNGCVLYFPFYSYGSNAQKIWDVSGQGNHGAISGSIPSSYPMLQSVASGSVTYGNMKISAVAGTAFVDFSAADVLTPYLDHLVVIKDSAGRVIQGYIKAAGTGETLSTIFEDDMADDDTALWGKHSSATLTFDTDHYNYANTTSANGIWATVAGVTYTKGKLIKATISVKRGTAGAQANIVVFCNDGTGSFYLPNISTTDSYVEHSRYGTILNSSVAGQFYYWINVNLGGSNYNVKLFTLSNVDTPSATGVTITSNKGGTAGDAWMSKDANFNYNDSSGYTYAIYQVPGHRGFGWFADQVDDRIVHSSLNLGTAHTLHYWLLYRGFAGVIHGGAVNYHGLRLTPTACSYNIGNTAVTVTHSAAHGIPVLFSIDRNGTSVDFYKNGVKIGSTQTLGANTVQVLTDFFRYSNGTSYWGGTIFEALAFNSNMGAQAIRNYFELSRSRYGV